MEELTPSSGSYPPKEEELKQNSIFSYMGRPTLGNPAHQIPSSHVDSPTHVIQKSQEGTSGMKEQNMSSTQNYDEQASKVCIEYGSDGMNAPSMTSSDGKNVPSMTSMKYDEQASTVCTFKQGGMCIIHNVVGSKFSVRRKDWTQKKYGTYGYVYKKITKYTCKEARRPTNIPFKNVLNGNEDSALTGSAPLEDGPLYEIQGTRISSNDVSGDNQGISGGGNPGLAASFESES